MTHTRLACSIVLLLTVAPLCVQAHDSDEKPQQVIFSYNLGPLGGQVKLVDDPAGDAKSGLEITGLSDDAPGKAAGLQVGDVIVGAPHYFGNDAYIELGQEIAEREAKRAGKPADLDLFVLRNGKVTVVRLGVVTYGSDARKFPEGDMGDALVAKSLDWLASQQGSDGAWESHNRVSDVVQTSLCGMAFLAAGHTPATGKFKASVKHAVAFVLDNVGVSAGIPSSGANNNMTNWSLGYGGMFLGEVQRAAPQPGLAEKLEWIRDQLEANMEESGGFAHGPGGPNSKGYTELSIVGNYCLAALGAIQANGIKIDEKKLETMKAYVESCEDGSGGIGYGAQRAGYIWYGAVGRTAGTLMAYGSLGDERSKLYRKMLKFYGDNIDKVLDAHVSADMAYLTTACMAWKQGKRVWAKFWETYRAEFTMVRNPDGSFTGRATDDSRKLGYCADTDRGAVWCTAHWAIIMSLPNDNLPVWFGKRGAPKNPAKDK